MLPLYSRFYPLTCPPSLTLGEVVPRRESDGLQLTISHKLDVQVPPAGADAGRAVFPAEAAEDGGETERPVAHLDVVELTLPGRLDGVLVVEEQVDALSGRGCSGARGDGDMGRLKSGGGKSE